MHPAMAAKSNLESPPCRRLSASQERRRGRLIVPSALATKSKKKVKQAEVIPPEDLMREHSASGTVERKLNDNEMG
jgi:hypothetical protein